MFLQEVVNTDSIRTDFFACVVLVALTNWHQEITLLDTTLTVLERPVLYFAIDNCHKMLCMGLLYLHRWSTQGVTLRILLTLFLLNFFSFVWRCGPARDRASSCLRFLDHTHSDAPRSVGLFWTSDQLVAEASTWQHTTLTIDKHPCPSRIRTHNSGGERP